MAEEYLVENGKKHSLIGGLFRLAVFAMTVYGMYTAAKKVTARLARRLEEDNEGNEEKRYFTCLRAREICPEGEVSELDVTTVAACVEVDLCIAELARETLMRLRTLGGQVVVKVPAMVRVELTGRGRVCACSSMVPSYENKCLPVIYVEAESLISNVKVEIQTEQG